MRYCCILLTVLFFPSAAQAGNGTVSVICAEPPSKGGAYRAAASATLALRKELASRGREVVDPTAALFPTGAAAKVRVKEARAAVKAAVLEYDSLEFGKAAEQLDGAVETLRKALALDPAAVSRAEYAKALHYRGAAAFYDGDKDAAGRYFADALAFAPGEGMDETIFPPDPVALFGEIREGLTQDGVIAVESTPPAEVYLDGGPAGVSPLKLEGLTPGTHLLRVQAPGYRPANRWVKVEAAQEAGLTIKLKPGKKLRPFTSALASVRAELLRSRPGSGVTRLTKLLRASSLVLVTRTQRESVQATWADGGFWVKRHQAKVADGREPLFAQHFLEKGAPVTPKVECRADNDCGGGRACTRDGRCLAAVSGGTPIYKKWWFWTIVGAAVVGGTVGAVVGSQPDNWTAAVRQGEWR